MLKKIEDIHELEVELVKLEGQNTSSKLNRQQINNLAHRNEEVMSEIKRMLHQSPPASDQPIASLQHHLQQRFEHLRSQVDNEYQFLKARFKQLEEKFRRGGDANNFNANINEIECLKTLIQSAKEKYEREKHFLFKEFANDSHLSNVFMQQRNELESCLVRYQADLQLLMRHLYSSLPSYSSLNTQRTNHDSSFLTEEEEAIKKISERITVLKARIDSKPAASKRLKQGIEGTSSDEMDNKELLHLNEQIRLLKSHMLAKGNELNKRKKNSNEAYLLNSTGSFNNTANAGPVYLPINHARPSTHFRETNFKAEPVQVRLNSESQNYFQHEAREQTQTRFYVVNKSGAKNLSCSPDRRYNRFFFNLSNLT